jgi:xanthine dehydrogenase molybdopterin-binding subunit B
VSAETYMEHVARALGRPPEEIREKNLYASRGATTHYKQVADSASLRRTCLVRHLVGTDSGATTHYTQVLDDCHIRDMWAEVKEKCEFASRRLAVDDFNRANRWRKRGLSMMPVKFGMSFTAKFMNQASALVHVYTDGTVLVSHGGTEMGQGLHTKMCQIAASELGVSPAYFIIY